MRAGNTGPRLGAVPGQTLTPRESAVLAAVERRLSNPEIAAELYISVRTVESHIASLKRKLGADSRAELIAAAGERRAHAASVRLPHTAFVGRDDELAALARLLDEHRWVTIVGPGGVGKTRLALEFASRHDLPVVVELEHAEPGDVVARIARALDLEAGPGSDPATSLALALASHPYLLVLDNVDRVGGAVGEVVARARSSAPGLRVLTTSRTPIGDPAETVFPLAPLSADGPDAAAVAMFLDRLGTAGRAAAAPMSLSAAPASAADRALAARVCERLDGLPLALELAAAVARHLSLEELAERLDRDFATLDRAAPEGRHRTLETAFEWTWDLLDDDEREVLCRLAALPRTFDVELAVAVTHPGAEGTLVRLLDHSMVVPTGGRPRRFRLLAVMREFVRARTDPATIREVLELHAEFMAGVVAPFAARARTDDSAEAMHTSETLCPELNAAVRWALAAGHPSALSLASYLAIGVEQYGSDVDSVRTLAQAARDERVLAEASAQQLLDLGVALAFLDLDVVDDLAIRAITIADDRPSQLAAHHLAGLAGAYHDRLSDALVHLGLAERLAMDLDDRWQLAAVRQMRGVAFRHAEPARLATRPCRLRARDARLPARRRRHAREQRAVHDGLRRRRRRPRAQAGDGVGRRVRRLRALDRQRARARPRPPRAGDAAVGRPRPGRRPRRARRPRRDVPRPRRPALRHEEPRAPLTARASVGARAAPRAGTGGGGCRGRPHEPGDRADAAGRRALGPRRPHGDARRARAARRPRGRRRGTCCLPARAGRRLHGHGGALIRAA